LAIPLSMTTVLELATAAGFNFVAVDLLVNTHS
jgi:hypothetical protein